MKTLHTIYNNFAKRFAVLLTILLTVGVSAVWGQQVAWDFASSDTELSNLSKDPISVSYAQNNGTNAVAISSSAFRLYKGSNSSTNGCSATFTIDNGYKIESITVIFKDGRTSARGKIDNGSYEDVFSAGNSKTVIISSLSAQSYSIQNQGTSTVAISSITITYSSDTSTPADLYVVTLMDDTDNPLSQTSAGGTVTLPERDGCTGYTFAGWTQTWTEEQEEWTTTAPDIIEAGTYTPKTNEFLYPVYTKTESGGSGFYLSVTKDAATYYIGEKGSGSFLSAVTDVNSAATFNIENNQYLYYGNKTYVSSTSDNTSLTIGTQTPSDTWSISESDGTITFKSNGTGGRYLAFNYNSGSPRFSSYADNASYPHTLTKHNTSTISYISVPNCCTQLAEVTDLEFSSITSNSITVGVPNTYAGKANASGYTFNCYSASTGGPLVATADKNGTSHTFTGLTKNTPYYFTVIAKGEGNYCNSAETSPRELSETLAQQYTVTLNPDGGTGDFKGWDEVDGNYTQTIEEGNYVTLPKLENQIAYTFGGWSDGTTTHNAGQYTTKADVELTAVWQAKTPINYRTLCEYEITWLIDENPYIDGTPTTTVQAGKTITTLPTNPTDNALGCCSDKFMGWTTSTAKTIEDQYLYETIEEIQAKFPSIYEDLTFRAVFATTAQGVGTSIADFSEMGYENNTAVTDPIILGDGEGHGDATITLAKAQSSSNAPTYYTDGEAVRIYAGGTITIASSYHIKNVAFTFAAGDGSNEITANSGTYADGVWTENVESPTNNLIITIGGEAGQHRRIASITVTTGVSGSKYTNYVTQCTTLPNPALSGGSVPAIAVNCGDFSTLSNSQAIVFSTMQDLTCPVTFEVIDGDFLISTAKDRAAQYQSKITVTPTKSGENIGKLKNVYVRANATDHNENFTGSLKVTSDEITGAVIIDLTATVTCNKFTLTTVDHLGNETEFGTYFAGDVIETEPTPSSDACTVGYTFDGWSTAEVEYGSLSYNKVSFPYTMPAEDVTLYPVYQVNTTADYHRVTSDLGLGDVDGNNWAGDYLIAASYQIVADGSTSNLGTINGASIDENIVPASFGDRYYVSLIAVKGGYVLKTQENKNNEKPYVYITPAGTSTATNANLTTADNNPLSVTYNSESDILITNPQNTLGYALKFYSTKFGFYKAGSKIYLYRKSPLYTSSLICEEITVENAMVTSTAGQTVKVNVTATMSNTTVDRTRNLTVESDNADFTATINPTATENEYNVAVSYTPSVEDITDGTETANITIKVNNIPVTSFQVTGRSLPEIFAIVAKVGNVWYALPSQGLNSETTPVGYPVEVDNNDNPTAVTSLPTTAEWSLRNVHKVNGSTDRFARNGENLVFINAENKTLYANTSNANIQTYAEYTNYAENNPERYEWVPTTTDLTNYTLKNVGRDKDLSINVNATFGTHASNIASNNLRFLPINATYNPFDMQVVEWYPTKVLVQTEAALTSVSATIGGVAVANPVVTKMGGKLYEISGLPLESNPTKILTISYDSYSCSKVIPIIISQDTKTVSDAPFSTLTKAIYNYSDLVVRDGAVLNITGAKNTPDKFVNVTIYPTAKIVVPKNNQLSVYSLTFFGGIDDIYDGEKYTTNKYGVPQLSLKGTLGKTVTTMDYIMRVNLDQMYQVGVPYDVNLNEITYWDGSAIKLGDELYVSAYDGQARANREKKTWIYETDFETKLGAATLKAGVGYTISAEPQNSDDTYSILRMPMKSNISSGTTEATKSINVVAYDNQKGVTITDNHKGWNYLSNPYMTTISGDEADTKLVLGYLKKTGTGPWEWVETTQRYVTIPMDNGKDYYQKKFSEAELKPFKSFFVQIAQGGELSFALASRQNAPARLLQQQTTSSEVEFELLLSNGKQSDNTGLLISEEYTPAYEINADLEKMTGAMSVYTIYNGYNLAYNALSPLNAEEQIPVGYIVPAKGEYTFALDPNSDLDAFKHIYLIDYEMGVTTDLIYDAYTFYTADTKSDKRFAIHIELFSDSENKPTGFEDVGLDSEQPYKFMYRGILYIMHNGVIYNTTGQQLNTMDK